MLMTFNFRFEAFNHFIRGLNINSNRHASSLDICTKFAKMEKLRFVLRGGKWGQDHRSVTYNIVEIKLTVHVPCIVINQRT